MPNQKFGSILSMLRQLKGALAVYEAVLKVQLSLVNQFLKCWHLLVKLPDAQM